MTSETKKPTGRAEAAAHPFRGALLRGLAVLCPPLLTVLIIVWAINTTKSYFLEPVTGWAREGLVWYVRKEMPPPSPAVETAADSRLYHKVGDGDFIPVPLYEWVRTYSDESLPTTGEGYYRRYVDLKYLPPYYAIPFFLSLFILLLYFLGKFMAAGIGGFIGSFLERLVARLPGVRAVYSAVKQVSDFIFTQSEIKFTRIVAVEYPRKGIWSMGFVTGEGLSAIQDTVAEPVLTVLIPYSPVPVTGCTITVRKSECIDLNITFDQACQFIVSCGVVVPPQLRPMHTEESG